MEFLLQVAQQKPETVLSYIALFCVLTIVYWFRGLLSETLGVLRELKIELLAKRLQDESNYRQIRETQLEIRAFVIDTSADVKRLVINCEDVKEKVYK